MTMRMTPVEISKYSPPSKGSLHSTPALPIPLFVTQSRQLVTNNPLYMTHYPSL